METIQVQRGRLAAWQIVNWFARLAALAVMLPLMQILFGEWGTGPAGLRGWIYLALFPCGFCAGYLLAWHWPVFGGSLSIACMIASLLVVGKIFALAPYLIWAAVCIPGVLFILAGWKLRSAERRQLA